jgi:hypothetical protein
LPIAPAISTRDYQARGPRRDCKESGRDGAESASSRATSRARHRPAPQVAARRSS